MNFFCDLNKKENMKLISSNIKYTLNSIGLHHHLPQSPPPHRARSHRPYRPHRSPHPPQQQRQHRRPPPHPHRHHR